MIFSKRKKQESNRTLYLHIGCGKTGSSALQIWFAKNSDSLKKQGYNYPLFGIDKKALHSYSITSGNGVGALEVLRRKSWADFIQDAFSEHPAVILSSENFQAATEEELGELKRVCKQQNVEVHVIAFVRDVYDISYSAYVQGVKRHNFKMTFSECVLDSRRLQQFYVIDKFETLFDRMTVMHYDTEKKKGLENSFCAAAGIDPDNVPAMEPKKVNRSLTVREVQLVRMANQVHFDRYRDDTTKFSLHLSDSLISIRPELDTEILYDPEVEEFLTDKYSRYVGVINEKYLQSGKLEIFSQEGKRVVDQESDLSEDVMIFISAMMESFHKLSSTKQGYLPDPEHTKRVILPSDSGLPEVLRDEAIKRETSDLKTAYCLMHAAATFRPKGPVIQAQLKEYWEKLDRSADGPLVDAASSK